MEERRAAAMTAPHTDIGSEHHAQRNKKEEKREEKSDSDAERKEGGEAVQESVQTRVGRLANRVIILWVCAILGEGQR
jgi:hypothetical protein